MRRNEPFWCLWTICELYVYGSKIMAPAELLITWFISAASWKWWRWCPLGRCSQGAGGRISTGSCSDLATGQIWGNSMLHIQPKVRKIRIIYRQCHVCETIERSWRPPPAFFSPLIWMLVCMYVQVLLVKLGWDLITLFTPHLHPSHPHTLQLVTRITQVYILYRRLNTCKLQCFSTFNSLLIINNIYKFRYAHQRRCAWLSWSRWNWSLPIVRSLIFSSFNQCSKVCYHAT